MKETSVCGVDCAGTCQSYGGACRGCNALEGAVPWAPMVGAQVCPVYACVGRRGFASCGSCDERPCALWLVDTRNPAVSDAEFERDIAARLGNLRGEG